jgi:transposase
VLLFIGDDWAEDHHDVEVQDEQGRVLRRVRLPEGIAGMSGFGELVGRFAGEDTEPSDVVVCIETDRGPWVGALVAAGYRVFGVDPKQAARHREILASSGAKSDRGDAHALADMARTRAHQLREVAADSEVAEAVKVVTRAHQTLIWERTRHMLRLRAALREWVRPRTTGSLNTHNATRYAVLLCKPACGQACGGLPDLRHGNDERCIVAATATRKAPEPAFPQFRGLLVLLPRLDSNQQPAD